MKRNLLMTTAVVALSTAASFATAQSLSSANELWTGGFVGIGGSFLDVSSDLYFEGYTEGGTLWMGLFETEGVEGEGAAAGSGMFGTIEIGADKQMNQLVFGGFASYDFGTASASTSAVESAWMSEGEGCCWPASVAGTINVGDNWAIGGRAGYLATPNTLIYGLAAISSAKMSVSVDSTLEGFFVPGDLAVSSVSPTMDVSGNTLGAGIEHMFNNNWSMKLEYRTTAYDGSVLSGEGWTDFEGEGYGGEAWGGVEVLDTISTQAIRATVNYRF